VKDWRGDTGLLPDKLAPGLSPGLGHARSCTGVGSTYASPTTIRRFVAGRYRPSGERVR